MQIILGPDDVLRIGAEVVVTVVEIRADRALIGVTDPRPRRCVCEEACGGPGPMNEEQWLASDDPAPMIRWLLFLPLARARKLRLFGCACVREVWPQLNDERSRRAVEVAERYADGEADVAEWDVVRVAAFRAAMASGEAAAECAAMSVTGSGSWSAAGSGSVFAAEARYEYMNAARRGQAALLRDFFHNPFQPLPVVDSACLHWQGGKVVTMARAIYYERAFDWLPILADALEDSGCSDRAILDHCRGPGPHYRGCWLVDLLLGQV